jgi:polysaccharide biosynthesis protein PslG
VTGPPEPRGVSVRKFAGTTKTVAIGVVALACALTSSVLTDITTAGAAKPNGPQAPFTADFFGMSAGAEITNLPDSSFDREMNLMKHIGVHWIRAVFPWAQVQGQDATAADEEWAYLDRLVNYAGALGMQVDAIIDNSPVWAQSSIPTIPCANQPSFNLTAYANFAAEVAARYPTSVVSAIELENAPNLPGNWVKPDACGYTQLMKEAYPAIKAANPTVSVLTGGLGAQNAIRKGQQGIAGDIFFGQMYAQGAQGYFDVLSWHPYSYPCTPSQSCPKNRPWYKTGAVRQMMIDHGDGAKPIWATEFGAPTNGTASDGHVTEAQQSSIMVDAMQQWVQLPYAGPFFVYEFRDHGTDATKKSDWFGVVSRDFTHKKIAYNTYQSLALG